MGKIDLGKPPYVFWMTVAIIVMVGFVVTQRMLETLSFTIMKDETKHGITYLGNGQVDAEGYSCWIKVFEGDLLEVPEGTFKVLKVESNTLTLVFYILLDAQYDEPPNLNLFWVSMIIISTALAVLTVRGWRYIIGDDIDN